MGVKRLIVKLKYIDINKGAVNHIRAEKPQPTHSAITIQ